MFFTLHDRFLNHETLVGVSWTQYSLKCAAVKKLSNGGYRLVKCHEVTLTEKTVDADGKILEQEHFSDALTQLFREAKLKKQKKVGFCVPSSSCTTKQIEFNADAGEAEILQQLMYNCERHLSYPYEEIYMDYQLLTPDLSRNTRSVALVATHRDNVELAIQSFEAAGLDPEALIPDGMVLQRFMSLFYPFDITGNETYLILGLYDESYALHIMTENETLFMDEKRLGVAYEQEDFLSVMLPWLSRNMQMFGLDYDRPIKRVLVYGDRQDLLELEPHITEFIEEPVEMLDLAKLVSGTSSALSKQQRSRFLFAVSSATWEVL